jgi:hypothetical protein
MICCVEGCEREKHTKGMCQYHYNKEWENNNKDKMLEYHRQYQKQYRANNKDKKHEQDKRYYDKNKESVLEYQKQYRVNNKELVAERKKRYYIDNKKSVVEYKKKYYEKQENKDKRNKLRKERYKNDPLFAVKLNLRGLLTQAFKRYSTKGKIMTSKKYGIDYKAVFDHLGPCPGPREEYHIDHIRPLCYFNFDDIEQVKQAFAPENHQWLKAEENLSKGGKY